MMKTFLNIEMTLTYLINTTLLRPFNSITYFQQFSPYLSELCIQYTFYYSPSSISTLHLTLQFFINIFQPFLIIHSHNLFFNSEYWINFVIFPKNFP